MSDEIRDAVRKLHANGLTDSTYETLPAAVDQVIEVVLTMRQRAQAHQRYDAIACPMHARIAEIEKRLGIVAPTAPVEATNAQEASL